MALLLSKRIRGKKDVSVFHHTLKTSPLIKIMKCPVRGSVVDVFRYQMITAWRADSC